LCEKAKKVEWMEELIKKITPESVHDFMDVYVVVPVEVWKKVVEEISNNECYCFELSGGTCYRCELMREIGGDVTQSSNGSSPEGRREDD
ncbi:MAG: hypothetical protein ACYSWO_29175, partial [Planctomycetota bacterium]